jgi:hypothetical protein
MLRFLLLLTFCAVTIPVLAEAGDASAVVQFCGPPAGESQGISQVTNQLERNLTYGRMILHFQAEEGGWSFLSGWYAHVPVTEKMVENRMPCFRQAMAASAQWSRVGMSREDPAIRLQSSPTAADTSTFGIPHLAFILFLSVLTVIVFLLPNRRKRPLAAREVEKMRRRRRPDVESSASTRSASRLDV